MPITQLGQDSVGGLKQGQLDQLLKLAVGAGKEREAKRAKSAEVMMQLTQADPEMAANMVRNLGADGLANMGLSKKQAQKLFDRVNQMDIAAASQPAAGTNPVTGMFAEAFQGTLNEEAETAVGPTGEPAPAEPTLLRPRTGSEKRAIEMSELDIAGKRADIAKTQADTGKAVADTANIMAIVELQPTPEEAKKLRDANLDLTAANIESLRANTAGTVQSTAQAGDTHEFNLEQLQRDAEASNVEGFTKMATMGLFYERADGQPLKQSDILQIKSGKADPAQYKPIEQAVKAREEFVAAHGDALGGEDAARSAYTQMLVVNPMRDADDKHNEYVAKDEYYKAMAAESIARATAGSGGKLSTEVHGKITAAHNALAGLRDKAQTLQFFGFGRKQGTQTQRFNIKVNGKNKVLEVGELGNDEQGRNFVMSLMEGHADREQVMADLDAMAVAKFGEGAEMHTFVVGKDEKTGKAVVLNRNQMIEQILAMRELEAQREGLLQNIADLERIKTATGGAGGVQEPTPLETEAARNRAEIEASLGVLATSTARDEEQIVNLSSDIESLVEQNRPQQ